MLNVYDLKIAHPDIFRQFSVKDNLVVHYKCPQSEILVKLYNHYNAIYFTLSGKKSFHSGDKTWFLSDDDSLLVRKGAYTQELFKDLDWEVLAFHFSDDFLKQIYQEFTTNVSVANIPKPSKDIILSISLNPSIKASFYGLLSFFNNKSFSEYLLEVKIKELVINILTEPKNIQILAFFNQISENHKSPLWHVMESNFMYKLSIKEFARLSHRSVTSFKNEFKNYYKTTPGKWLLNKRLSYAKQQLLASNKTISEIIYESGFENMSHFSRVFKNRFGKPPTEYRKEHTI